MVGGVEQRECNNLNLNLKWSEKSICQQYQQKQQQQGGGRQLHNINMKFLAELNEDDDEGTTRQDNHTFLLASLQQKELKSA